MVVLSEEWMASIASRPGGWMNIQFAGIKGVQTRSVSINPKPQSAGQYHDCPIPPPHPKPLLISAMRRQRASVR